MKLIKMFKVLAAYELFLCKFSTFHVNIVADKHLYEYVIFTLVYPCVASRCLYHGRLRSIPLWETYLRMTMLRPKYVGDTWQSDK